MVSYWAGAMSGTSVDGVDVVVCAFDDDRLTGVVDRASVAFPAALRCRLLALQQAPDSATTVRELAELDQAVSQRYVAAFRALSKPWPLSAAGMHGQTLFHDPVGLGTSLQLGNPHVLAAALGCPVVADFRRADIAEGGQGAPLVPAFHRALWQRPGEALAVVNIGGIANITWLHADGRVEGHDLGPGNALMDAWTQAQRDAPFDTDGAWAASGQVDPTLLAALRQDPWFEQPPPRSTGRDQFNLEWVRRQCPDCAPTAADLQRTLLELTATLVADAARLHGRRLVLCGGGAHNRFLRDRIIALLPTHQVEDSDALGLPPQWVEAAAFAWLARERLLGRASGLPAVTGARCAAVQGVVARPATPAAPVSVG